MALLEGFESFSGSLPDTLAWSVNEGDTTGVSQSALNVTEGSFSLLLVKTALFVLTTAGDEQDLSGASTLYMDVTVASASGGGYILLQASATTGGFEQISDQTTPDSTGSFTLEIDLSGFADASALNFQISTDGTITVNTDNLRDDTGGGASVGSGLITGLKLNRMSLV
jgi:hypothetical protein